MKQNRGFAAVWGLIIVAVVLVGGIAYLAVKYSSDTNDSTPPPATGVLPPPANTLSERDSLYDAFGKITNWTVTDPFVPGSDFSCPGRPHNPNYKVLRFSRIYNEKPNPNEEALTAESQKVRQDLQLITNGWTQCASEGDTYRITTFEKNGRLLRWSSGNRLPVLGGYYDIIDIEYAN